MGMIGPEWDKINFCCAAHYAPSDITFKNKRRKLNPGAKPQVNLAEVAR